MPAPVRPIGRHLLLPEGPLEVANIIISKHIRDNKKSMIKKLTSRINILTKVATEATPLPHIYIYTFTYIHRT